MLLPDEALGVQAVLIGIAQFNLPGAIFIIIEGGLHQRPAGRSPGFTVVARDTGTGRCDKRQSKEHEKS